MAFKNKLIYIISILLISNQVIANDAEIVANEPEVVNEKFSFVKEIYNESWALIIGINKYQNVPPLIYAVDDAVAVKDMFIEKYGFKEENIILITDDEATKDNIIQGFSDILTKAKEKDRVVVFYAGHGETYKLPSGGDMGYLIPVDGNVDNLYLSSIPMKSIYDIAEMSYAKHILYLVDACYGGLAMNTRGLKKNQTPEYLKKMTRERGRQVITAGGKDEQVQERPEWGHSAFTKNLLKGLNDGLADENMDGIITGDELGGFIKNRVVMDVDGAHTPQKGRIGSDMGEFVFISETLDGQFVDSSPGGEKLSDLEAEMVEIKKLLKLQSQQRAVGDNFSTNNLPKVDKVAQMKKAIKLSWVFPGAGHFVTGNTGKGLFFTSMELAALVGLAVFSGNHSDDMDTYNSELSEYEIWSSNEDVIYGNWSDNELSLKRQQVNDAFSAQQQTLYGLIGCGTVSGAIWLWNIIDVKKSKSDNYSDNNRFSMGVNKNGHIEARISF